MCCTAFKGCRELSQPELALQVSLQPTCQRIIFCSPMQSTPCSRLLCARLKPLPCSRTTFGRPMALLQQCGSLTCSPLHSQGHGALQPSAL